MLEDRNAPGSVLGELVAAARGEAVPSPLDQVGWLLGPGLLPPVTDARADVISVRAAEPRTPAPPAVVPLLPQPDDGADRDDTGYNGGQASSPVGVGLPVDDDPLFLSVTAPAPVAQLATGAAGMADPNAAGGGGGGAVSAGLASAGVAVSAAAPAGSGQPAPAGATFFVLPTSPPPAAQTANAASSHPTQATPAAVVTAAPTTSPTAVSTTQELEADLPPNTAPVANGDTATVDEDGSVVIDVLANDTDDDGDTLQIDSFDWQPTNGTVTETDDGKLQYTPFADFNGTDSFTYVATDGQDVSNTATVTVTVNPVNDPPVAFNDLFQFVNDVADGDPYWDPAWGDYPYMPAGPCQVTANDFDLEDGTPGGYIDLNTTGTVGTVTMNSNGSFFYEGPWDFVGDTSFQYQVADSSGALSGWATVILRVTDPNAPPPPPVAANPDTMVVGEDPTTFNVTANDSGGGYAVLAAPPGVGITGFDFDGTAHYAPRADGVPIGGQLSYNLFASAGAGTASATADMNPVQMDIYNGQGAQTPVDVKVRETVGAFTVVNKNDTDGDGTVDNVDTAGVHAADGVGANEMDLMRLRVYKPAGYVEGEAATVTVTHGAGRLFLSPNREGDGTSALLVDTFIDSVTGQPVDYRDFWAEVYDTSNVLRDISIQMKYKNQTLTVKATGIWATFDNPDGFHVNPLQKNPGQYADDKDYKAAWDLYGRNVTGFHLGMPDMMTSPLDPRNGQAGFTVILANLAEFAFTVLPAGVETQMGGKIKFDVSRTLEMRAWNQLTGKPLSPPVQISSFPAFREQANDDVKWNDEDDLPNNNQQLYSWDVPGYFVPITPAAQQAGDLSGGAARLIERVNAQEFVRVKLDGSLFHDLAVNGGSGNGVKGSRASDYVDWRAWIDFSWDPATKTWVRKANTDQNTYNEIALGPPRDLGTPALP